MKREHSLLWALAIGIALIGVLSLHTSSEIIVGSLQGDTRTTYYGWPAPFGSVAVQTEISMQDGKMAIEESTRVKIQWTNLCLTFLGCMWAGLAIVTRWNRNRRSRQPPGYSPVENTQV